jgi:hypothetical protein
MSEPIPGMVYTLTNPYMPGLVKIGRSANIEQRIADLSRPTGVPGAFVLEFAKSVTNSSEKERQLHSILSDKRVKDSEFFKATSEEVRALFALMEGDWITPTRAAPARAAPARAAPVTAAPARVAPVTAAPARVAPVTAAPARVAPVTAAPARVAPARVAPARVAPARVAPARDAPARVEPAPKKHRTKILHPELHEILEDGQQVYHTIADGTEWIATFNRELNKIVYNGAAYTINHFTKTHYKQERPDRDPECNAWKEIKTIVDGQMIRLDKLERLKAQALLV